MMPAEGKRALYADLAAQLAALLEGESDRVANTSNPAVMIGAGLLAKKAVERGLKTQPWVKTSLAPGSKVVMEYLHATGVQPHLEQLGFHLVGFGCTTCIGNSGPLPDPIAAAVSEKDMTVAAVLSGNRNFEGRVHPQVRANYLASPPLVVAYALAGSVDVDIDREPLGANQQGQPVYLRDIWPTQGEVADAMQAVVKPELFARSYAEVFSGIGAAHALSVAPGDPAIVQSAGYQDARNRVFKVKGTAPSCSRVIELGPQELRYLT